MTQRNHRALPDKQRAPSQSEGALFLASTHRCTFDDGDAVGRMRLGSRMIDEERDGCNDEIGALRDSIDRLAAAVDRLLQRTEMIVEHPEPVLKQSA